MNQNRTNVKDRLYIYLAALKNDQHFQLFSEFGDTVDEFDPETLKILPLYEAWCDKFDLEDEALKKIKRSAQTEVIRLADEKRSSLFRGLAGLCKIGTIHYKDCIKTAARALQVIFDTYGNIARKQLSEKTSAYFNLLQELRKNEEAVKIVGLEGWMDELEAVNSECHALMKDRWTEVAGRTKIVVKEARADVDAAYDAILRRITALREVEGLPVYDEFLNRWAAVIATYNAALARRGKSNSAADDTTGASSK